VNSLYKKFITEILERASEVAKSNFGKVSGTAKIDDSNQVLTKTDLEIGKLIVSLLFKQYPNHNIIDEEAGIINNHSKYTWVIDPIDGTSNFANGVPLYGTMIGLLEEDVPIAGGISLPPFNEIYVAEKNKGAFCNGKKLQITKETRLLSTLVAYTLDGHQENPRFTRDECALMADIILNIRNLRNSGSCFDAAMVAKGKFGAYLNRTSKIWDNVAQQILIEEAGGVYTDFLGKPMDYTSPLTKANDNFTLCAASPILHKQLQKIIHKNL
jgi:myo-inositol-1(or 4)-monophosphatase